MSRLRLALVLACLVIAVATGLVAASPRSAAGSPGATSISFAYDDAGRLAAAIDPGQTNGAASYGWDAVGNLSSVTRGSSSALSVLWLSPSKGQVGAAVRVYGAGSANQVWALDFQFDTTTDGRTLKLLHVVDEHTREALAIRVARSIDADHAVRVLDQIVSERGRGPELVRMDNGPWMTANALRDWCRFGGAGRSFIEPGSRRRRS